MSKPTIEDMQAALIHIQKEKIEKLQARIDAFPQNPKLLRLLDRAEKERDRYKKALEKIVEDGNSSHSPDGGALADDAAESLEFDE